MPEMPEVEGLRAFLEDRCTGRAFDRIEVVAFSALKTVAVSPGALVGLEIDAVARWGKFLGLGAQGTWLIWHLSRAGWLTWKPSLPDKPARPGKGPLALRVGLDDGSGFDLTEAGTQKKLAVYVVADPRDVPGIARLGPDPLADDFGEAEFDAILEAAGRAQIKGVLRDQSTLAGIGNAYSDEICHAARLSPFKPASGLDAAERARLFAAVRATLGQAIERAVGASPSQLKDGKRTAMAVHGRTGLPCPVCGTEIAEVSFADSSLQYCPICQTGGKPLADRRMSRLLK